MATFNGREWTVADMLPFKYVENWDDFFDDVIEEMSARSAAVASALTSSSTTSLPIGTGSKSLTVGTNKAFDAGQPVVIAVTADVTKYMYGSVTSYNTTTGALEASVSEAAGSGTYSAWTVSLVGLRGAAGGATLPPGTVTAPGLAVTGDANTGIAQVGGADTISLVAGGIEAARAVSVPSAVNRVELVPSVAGGVAGVRVDGADSSGNLGLWPKGAGWLVMYGAGVPQVVCLPVAGANRYLTLSGAVGGNPTISTNAGALNLTSATGQVLVNGAAIGVSFPSAGQKTGAYTVTAADAGKLIPCYGSWTLSLLAAATAGAGFPVILKNTGSGSISVAPNGSDTVDTAPSGILGPGGSVILICDGTRWLSVGGVSWSASGAAWSPTAKSTTATLSNSNLTVAFATSSQWRATRAGSPIPSGKYYWEVRCDSGSGSNLTVGILDSTFTNYETQPASPAFYRSSGDKQNSTGGTTTFGSSWTSGDVIGVAVDVVAGKIWFARNGVWQASGDPAAGTNAAFSSLTGTLYPAVGAFDNATFTARFKSADFGYAIPGGFSTIP